MPRITVGAARCSKFGDAPFARCQRVRARAVGGARPHADRGELGPRPALRGPGTTALGGNAADPPAATEAREVYAAIAALPDDYRDALVAIDVAGLSYREAARALRVREGTITSRVYRARGKVAESLRDARHDGSAGL